MAIAIVMPTGDANKRLQIIGVYFTQEPGDLETGVQIFARFKKGLVSNHQVVWNNKDVEEIKFTDVETAQIVAAATQSGETLGASLVRILTNAAAIKLGYTVEVL